MNSAIIAFIASHPKKKRKINTSSRSNCIRNVLKNWLRHGKSRFCNILNKRRSVWETVCSINHSLSVKIQRCWRTVDASYTVEDIEHLKFSDICSCCDEEQSSYCKVTANERGCTESITFFDINMRYKTGIQHYSWRIVWGWLRKSDRLSVNLMYLNSAHESLMLFVRSSCKKRISKEWSYQKSELDIVSIYKR